MKIKVVSGIILTVLLIGMLFASFGVSETLASPTVRVYVKMPNGYIPGVPVNNFFQVELWIDGPPEWTNTSNGIVGWSLYVHANASVLEPMDVSGATQGYWLYDFCYDYSYFGNLPNILFNINKASGTFDDIAEFIMGWGMLGVGAGGSGLLCNLTYKSLSETAYTLIDLFEVYYYTIDGMFPADVVVDGHYNLKIKDLIEATRELIETIETWNLPKGIETSLTSKLQAAYRLLDMGNQIAVIGQLTAFTNEVEALRNRKLTDEQVNQLTSEAQRIIDLING